MSLRNVATRDFRWTFSQIRNTTIAGTLGTTITPGNGAKGSWVELIAAADVDYDVWEILLNFNSGFTATAARLLRVDIGIDPAGGSAYTVLLPDLIASNAGSYPAGHWYRFPIHIPAGASIGARARYDGSAGTFRGFAQIWGLPSHPEHVWKGSQVEAIGFGGGSNVLTQVTAGNGGWGSWTSLGTVTRTTHAFELGYHTADTSTGAVSYYAELAAFTGQTLEIVENIRCSSNTNEENNKLTEALRYRSVPVGTEIFGRLWNQSGSGLDGYTGMCFYAVS